MGLRRISDVIDLLRGQKVTRRSLGPVVSTRKPHFIDRLAKASYGCRQVAREMDQVIQEACNLMEPL